MKKLTLLTSVLFLFLFSSAVFSSELYWIGGSGDWSDGSHWSYSSGGPVAGVIPTIDDSVYFDMNSFSSNGQIVTIDISDSCQYMDWQNIANTVTLELTTDFFIKEGAVLSAMLTINGSPFNTSELVFIDDSELNPNNAVINCMISVNTFFGANNFTLTGNLTMTDTASLLLYKGTMDFDGYDIRTGYIIVKDSSGTAKTLNFSSSKIHLCRGFSSENALSNFTLNAGTSDLYIGDTSVFISDTIYGNTNFLRTADVTFNDVTLEFGYPGSEVLPPIYQGVPPNDSIQGFLSSLAYRDAAQNIIGNNKFNNLTILKKSAIYIEAGSEQEVIGTLQMYGTCQDSIYLISSTSAKADFVTSLSSSVNAACINFTNIGHENGILPPPTVYFSNGYGSNPGWNFDASDPVTADFTVSGSLCANDIVHLNNNSTVQDGVASNLLEYWYFGDGFGYFDTINYDKSDSIWIGYIQDTSSYMYNQGGEYTISLKSGNKQFQCYAWDSVTIYISDPHVFLSSNIVGKSICEGETVTFKAVGDTSAIDLQFYLNNNLLTLPSDTIYTTNTLKQNDTITLRGVENGCPTDSIPFLTYVVHDLPTFSLSSTIPSFTICEKDSITFNANGIDTTYQFKFLVNNVPKKTGLVYKTNQLYNQDTLSLVVTDTNFCRDTLSEIITVNPLPLTKFTSSVPNKVICDGDTVLFTGNGADKYEYFVNGIAVNSPSTTNTWKTPSLNSGDVITLKGYSNFGCQKIADTTISYTVNSIPTVQLSSSTPTTVCSDETIKFTASGASMYEFFINGSSVQGPSPINTLTDYVGNNDEVHVIGEFGGCYDSSSVIKYTVKTAPTTTITTLSGTTVCANETAIFQASGASKYQFYIDGIAQGPMSTTSTFSSSSINNGQTVSVIGEVNGCQNQDAALMTILPAPTIMLNSSISSSSICYGDPIAITGANGDSYELFVNNSSIGVPQASPIFNPSLPVGKDTLYIVGSLSNGCSDTSNQYVIDVNPIPTVSITSSVPSHTICSGDSVYFYGAGANNYQLFIDGVSQGGLSPKNTFAFTNIQDNQVITLMGDSYGCQSISSGITFTVNTVPTISLTSDDVNNIFCQSQLVEFTASGADDYQFIVNGNPQGPFSSQNTINSVGFPIGASTVKVVGNSTNCFDEASTTIMINPLPAATISSSVANDSICSGDNIVYTASGGSVYSYFINSTQMVSSTPFTQYSPSSLSDGDTVKVVVTSNFGCVDTAFASSITVLPNPVMTLVSSDLNTDICIGDTVVFTANGAAEYEFFINGTSQGTPSSTNSIKRHNLTDGSTIYVEGIQLGCSSQSSVLTFDVHNYPVVKLINNASSLICVDDSVDLTAQGATNYSFFINGTPDGGYSTNPNYKKKVNNGDVITVSGELNGCISTADTSYQYTVYNYPVLTLVSSDSDNSICKGDTVQLTASGAMQYEFEYNGTTVQFDTNSVYNTHTLEDNDSIIVTGYNGVCASASQQFTFVVNKMDLELEVLPSNFICDGTSVQMKASGADLYQFYINGVAQGTLSPSNTFTLSNPSDSDELSFYGKSSSTLCYQKYKDYIIMNIMDNPVITSLGALQFCEGDSVILSSSSSYGNQWVYNGNPLTNETDTNLVAYKEGTYTLNVTHGGNNQHWAYGNNAKGNFGNGANFNSLYPKKSLDTVPFIAIEAGKGFALGLTPQGKIYSWGENEFGQLGNGTYTNSNKPSQILSLSNVIAIAASYKSSVAVTINGDVYVWGENNLGQLGMGNTSVINFPTLNPYLSGIDSVIAGKNHFILLKNDGTVWSMGDNSKGQLGHGNLIKTYIPQQIAGLSSIETIGAGDNTGFAIDSSGLLYVWGDNSDGQLGLGDFQSRLIPTPSLKNIASATGAAAHSIFVTKEGLLYTSGANNYGQLGLGDQNQRLYPTLVNIPGVKSSRATQYSTLLLRNDGSVFGFGGNLYNQISPQTDTTILSPYYRKDVDGVTAIELGVFSSHLIYGIKNTCSSSTTINVIVDSIPDVIITITDGFILSTTKLGASYQWYYNGLPIPGATNSTYEARTDGNYSVKVTFNNGCSDISDEVFVGVSGIKEEINTTVVGYPNPTNTNFNLKFSPLHDGKQVQLTVMDDMGRVIFNKEVIINGKVVLPVYDFDAGVYLISIRSKQLSTTISFVKVN